MAVQFEVDGRVARVTVRRPAALNAINEEVLTGLGAAVDEVRARRELRALVVRGEGEAFCVGLDLEVLRRGFAEPAYFRDVLGRVNRLLLDIESLDVPVVAAVNGLARAGGFELILACDLAVVAEEARIGDVHTRFGVMPGGGSTQRAPRKLGDQRARELIYTSRWLSGTEAAAYGIALRAVPLADLDHEVDALVGRLVDKSRDCLAAAKAAILAGVYPPPAEAVDIELDHFFRYLDTSPDAREGFTASLEGRPPAWA